TTPEWVADSIQAARSPRLPSLRGAEGDAANQNIGKPGCFASLATTKEVMDPGSCRHLTRSGPRACATAEWRKPRAGAPDARPCPCPPRSDRPVRLCARDAAQRARALRRTLQRLPRGRCKGE